MILLLNIWARPDIVEFGWANIDLLNLASLSFFVFGLDQARPKGLGQNGSSPFQELIFLQNMNQSSHSACNWKGCRSGGMSDGTRRKGRLPNVGERSCWFGWSTRGWWLRWWRGWLSVLSLFTLLELLLLWPVLELQEWLRRESSLVLLLGRMKDAIQGGGCYCWVMVVEGEKKRKW